MQFRKPQKEAVRAGRITCSFRAWQRPQAKLGGRYNLHPEGAIEVTGLTTPAAGEITRTDAERAR